jgi:ribosomal-protein-alanine N-acetyltransferase
MSQQDLIELRSVEPFDLAIAAAIHSACFAEPWSTDSLAQLLAMPGAFGFLALRAGTPVGLMIVQATGEDADLLTLCVLPEQRRQAIATRMLDGAREMLRAQGCRRLLLEVADDNLPGKALYGKTGLRQVNRRRAYYQRGSASVDALVLAWDLA